MDVSRAGAPRRHCDVAIRAASMVGRGEALVTAGLRRAHRIIAIALAILLPIAFAMALLGR